jgi:L-alanine-DL-glutamate epimerase-like enolase superfamily enzyme
VSPTITGIEVLTAELPFRFSFGHALAERRSSTNVYVRLTLDDATVGYGEGVPREYVTGETVESALEALCERQAPALVGRALPGPDEVAELLEDVPDTAPDGGLDLAARCALELALLDAAGKHFGCSIQRWLGGPAPFVTYDAILPFSSPKKLVGLAVAIRALRIRQVKIKVGADLEKELRSLELLRRILGPDADIRVDANCAWTADEALAAIERMRPYRISAVEQPVAGDDLDGLARITAETSESIIVDESLRTLDDARALVDARACNAFNIRVSKNGGVLNAMRLARIAREAGLDCVVGAQVGESAILSAAGRHVAAAIGTPRYVEGSGGSLLLKEDLAEENVLPGLRGRAKPHTGPGLGLHVKEDALRRAARSSRTLGTVGVEASHS